MEIKFRDRIEARSYQRKMKRDYGYMPKLFKIEGTRKPFMLIKPSGLSIRKLREIN